MCAGAPLRSGQRNSEGGLSSGAISHFEENDFEARETSRFSNLQPGGPLRRSSPVGRGSNPKLSSRWVLWKRDRRCLIIGPNSSER